MEIKDYPSNTLKDRVKTNNTVTPITTEKKVDKVVTGKVVTKKKNGFEKFFTSMVENDLPKVKEYVFSDVLIPSIKKAISDIVRNGIDLILYGDANRNKSNIVGSKVSYRSYYDNPNVGYTNSLNNQTRIPERTGLDYDNIILNNRGDAELVLTQMEDIIQQYGMVKVADLYDLIGISNNNHCAYNYGWTNLSSATYVLTRNGYQLKLPRAVALN